MSNIVNQYGESGVIKELLWTNPNPSSNFAGQSISLSDLSKYDSIIVQFKSATTDDSVQFFAIAMTTNNIDGGAYIWNSLTSNTFCRAIRVNSNNVNIGNAIRMGNTGTYNQYGIPKYIYGIKGLKLN